MHCLPTFRLMLDFWPTNQTTRAGVRSVSELAGRVADREQAPEAKYIALVRGLLLVYPIRTPNPTPETDHGLSVDPQPKARQRPGRKKSVCL